MKHKPRNKRKLNAPKSILRLPDLEAAKSAVLNSLSCPDAQRGYRHAIDEFVVLLGAAIVVSARPWWCGTECIWSRAISLQVPSTFVSEQCGVLPTRRQTAGCSAPIWRRESGGSRASRNWVSGSATG